MRNAVRSVVIGGMSLSLLSGCIIDDPYDYPTNNPPATSDEIVVYGPQSTGDFHLQVTDSNNITAEVDTDGYVNRGNISTRQLVPNQNQGFLNVRVASGTSENQSASIQAVSINDQAIDVSTAEEKGTLQFEIRVHEKVDRDAPVTVTLTSDEPTPQNSAPSASVDITEAVNAFIGADTQFIKLPLDCFAQHGVDLSQSLTPFSIATESDINFDFGNVRLLSNSDAQWYVLPCEKDENVKVLDEQVSELYIRPRGSDIRGWATRVAAWGAWDRGWPGNQDYVRAFVKDDAFPGQGGGIVFRTPDDEKTKDLSRYIEKGVLEFMIRVVDYADHPTQVIRLKMESTAGRSSEFVNLEPGFADGEWRQVRIPMKQFFTKGDGKIDATLLQDVNRPISIMAAPVQAPDTLEGMEFHISGIRMRMN